jgi:hypothetical protein
MWRQLNEQATTVEKQVVFAVKAWGPKSGKVLSDELIAIIALC